MFDSDPLTMVSLAHDATQLALQAGPPADLPGAVPDFVGRILSEISGSIGDASGGLGETISRLATGQ